MSSTDAGPVPHPLVTPFAGLVGTWVGDGVGRLPGRDEFTWRERFEVGHAGTPALWFRQRTRRPDGSPFHPEDGWVRLPPELQGDAVAGALVDRGVAARAEVVVASPTGIVETLAGDLLPADDGCLLDVSSTTVARTPAAGEVLATRRRWTLTGDRLVTEFWMATPAEPDGFHHLTATLHRAD